MKKDFLTLFDWTEEDFYKILKRAHALKALRRKGKKGPRPLEGKTVALIFEKPSTRTRVSFEVAVTELGGQTLTLDLSNSQLGRGETYSDTGKVLSRYVHGIVFRTFGQNKLEELAAASTIPVINALSDLYHPCQLLADLMTIQEEKKDLSSVTVAYLGDGNNLTNSWIAASLILGFNLRVATPKGCEPPAAILKKIGMTEKEFIQIGTDPQQAVTGADVLYTDTWVSMGQENNQKNKEKFSPFQINKNMLSQARKGAIVMHCLPAHRGDEITDDVMDGPQSRIFNQAENRLHVQKAVLEALIK
ncbi:MAG: ornithine carbamoyltransferase [bacterium]|nr:ornithine carbamoyltransferase [bacterium]